MLNKDKLTQQIKEGIQMTIIPAIERIILIQFPNTSKAGDELAKSISTEFDEMVSEPLAGIIANAIDSYIKNAAITGTIITVGSPTTQTAKINSMPQPITNGKVPNTLGIS